MSYPGRSSSSSSSRSRSGSGSGSGSGSSSSSGSGSGSGSSSSSSSSSSHPYIKAALTPKNPKPSALPKAEAPASARDEAAEDGLALGVEELLGLGGLNFEGFGVRVLGFRGLKILGLLNS